ncbi:MAG: hypothetical protein HZA94_00775 [Candidatus Vogelbacteria bacterium]|nr:hypothetical protein [Candidatus Vogelbacteria bacterium]
MAGNFLVPRSLILVAQYLELKRGQYVNTYRVYRGGRVANLDNVTRRNLIAENEFMEFVVVTGADDNFFYYEVIRIINVFGDPLKQVLRRFKLPNEQSPRPTKAD